MAIGATFQTSGAAEPRLYLPLYSLDFNPIEKAFSKVKHILKRLCHKGWVRTLRDFASIAAFMSAREIDEIQAAVDKRGKARVCCVGDADVAATPVEEPHALETGFSHKCPGVVFSDVNSSHA